ncbi:MAG: hypothetical protein H6642_01030 [Caldilineaceae bacterium]|nr:hypothetical protein [Caldilineaceae bacterium]
MFRRQLLVILSALIIGVIVAGCTATQTAAPAANADASTATEEPAAAEASPAGDESSTSEEATTVETPAETGAEPAAADNEATVMTKINLNDMTAEELEATIPDFGSRMVREFFEYQPYVSILQFRQEIGKYVDDAQVAQYEEYVYVPIDVNESDAATIEQIPGVDATAAQALIDARTYGSTDAFLSKLAEVAPDADPAVATAYLAGN